MGVPKFYRWISERYPCLSEVVKEYQIPEFDNLYFDMNGIIHNCSHPNDDDPHFRITEDQIFLDIFHYIEFLYRIIKPRKVFFMAVDGVAPRAKMNQQRGRRFRTAREAQAKEEEAVSRGEVLPSEDRFDSNCITPGTEFMTRLHEQLKYFISAKVSTDKSWQGIEIYLSGHETPGEGEHKIMDFIRYHKSQKNYNPNTKHCLYGLDADLIMLGLCSHEPHFSLLREEVKFGNKNNQKRTVVPEQTTFHLLHLSLMREYLEHEFSALKGKLNFPFDIESVIDDWVLMGFLVGNDFIPNIPQMHIRHDALPLLYQAYIEVLPTLGGYINEKGTLNLQRFQMYLNKLAQSDREMFTDVCADIKYLETKSGGKKWRRKNEENGFLDVLGSSMSDDNAAVGILVEVDDPDDKLSEDESDDSESLAEMEFTQHKRDYYMNKMDYAFVDQSVLKEQAYEYVRAIQWNLHYYYNGIASWSWYYPHHYAPYISDVANFSEMDLSFDFAKPFLPFEQLLAVLPSASKKLLPAPFQKLMVDENSSLKHFYPEDFITDLNGKQQDWEAVVLIPFIDEKLLLESMKPLYSQLTADETRRNSHGPHLLFTHSKESLGPFLSSRPEVLPDLNFNHALCTEIEKGGFMLKRERIMKGLCDGVRLDIFIPGFPSLKHVKHTAELKKGKVKVFQMTSRGENMMLKVIKNNDMNLAAATNLIGKVVFVGWPHLSEAKVNAISDGEVWMDEDKEFSPLSKDQKAIHRSQCAGISSKYAERFGVEIGDMDIVVRVNILTGKRFAINPDGKVIIEKLWGISNTPIAFQTVVKDIEFYVPEVEEFNTVDDLFAPGTICFMLGQPCYGCMGEVLKTTEGGSSKKLEIKFSTPKEPNFDSVTKKAESMSMSQYHPGFAIAKRLGINGYLFSRITGSIFVQTNSIEAMAPIKINIGLNLKFKKRNEEVPGYTKLTDDQWFYSGKALDVMNAFMMKFPRLFDNIGNVIDEDVIHVDNLFPEGGGAEYIKQVKLWLEEQPCTSLTRQTCGANVLDPAIVTAIENVVDDSKAQNKHTATLTLCVKPEFLYRPHNMHGSSYPDSQATYQLYDRVVNIRQSATVPLGLRGTIIGIHAGDKSVDTLYDVVFDDEFVGGISLNCSFKRGYRLHACALINLSHGIRKMCKKTTVQNPGEYSPSNSQEHNRNSRRDSNNGRLYSQVTVSSTTTRTRDEDDRSQTSPKKSQMTVLQSKSSSRQRSNRNAGQGQASPEKQILSRTTPLLSPQPILQQQSKQPQVARSTDLFTFEDAQHTPKRHTVASTTFHKSDLSALPSTENDHMSVWNALTKMGPLGQPPTHNSTHFPPPPVINNEKTYGKQVSVQELFEKARSAENKFTESPPIPTPLQQQPQIPIPLKMSASDELESIFRMTNSALPQYSFSRNGPMALVTCFITLPNGRTFFSNPSHTIDKAKERASELALLSVKNESSFTVPNYFPVRPPLPPPFSGIAYPTPPSFPSPPVSLSMAANALPKFQNQCDLSVMRKIAPPAILSIPDSFVQYNQQLELELAAKQAAFIQPNFPRGAYIPSQPLYQPPKAYQAAHLQQQHQQQQQQQLYTNQVGSGVLGVVGGPTANVMGAEMNWSRGWQPESPHKFKNKQGHQERTAEKYSAEQRHGHGHQRSQNSQSPNKQRQRRNNSTSQVENGSENGKNRTSDNIPITPTNDLSVFIPSQVARRQAGASKGNPSKELSPQQNLVDGIRDLQVTSVFMGTAIVSPIDNNSNSSPAAQKPKNGASPKSASNSSRKKSRLAVNFPKKSDT